MSQPARIAWGMVAYGPFPYAPVYVSHMQVMARASRVLTERGDGSRIHFIGSTDRMYTHSAENLTVREFLETDSTHLFLTEMDMVLPADTIERLLALGQPIASGLYFLRGGRGQPCLYAKALTPPGNPYPHSPVTMFPTDRPFAISEQGGGCPGLGCVLIAREVFERVPYPWFDLKESNYGSDMYFYTKVREAGIQVWVEPAVRCGHMDYTEVTFDDYLQRIKDDPKFLASGFLING